MQPAISPTMFRHAVDFFGGPSAYAKTFNLNRRNVQRFMVGELAVPRDLARETFSTIEKYARDVVSSLDDQCTSQIPFSGVLRSLEQL